LISSKYPKCKKLFIAINTSTCASESENSNASKIHLLQVANVRPWSLMLLWVKLNKNLQTFRTKDVSVGRTDAQS